VRKRVSPCVLTSSVANASLRIHTRRGYNSTGSRLWPGGRKCLPLKSYPDTKRSGCPLEMPNPAQARSARSQHACSLAQFQVVHTRGPHLAAIPVTCNGQHEANEEDKEDEAGAVCALALVVRRQLERAVLREAGSV